MSELAHRVAARYVEVNGDHPMTPVDDAYVQRYFVTLDELCVGRDETPDQIRTHMLAGRLPLPSYLRSVRPDMIIQKDRLTSAIRWANLLGHPD